MSGGYGHAVATSNLVQNLREWHWQPDYLEDAHLCERKALNNGMEIEWG